ncbi:hypothetical protein [Actinophytocola sp.]|uniref:hypothetical protein n=1 Tax=Actinophytocola sp. TaxID=1872138 RepID=UPI003D6A55B6
MGACSPESFQGAVAAGLLSIDTRRGAAASDVAQLLQEAVAEAGGADAETIARSLVERCREDKRRIPGVGNPLHKGDRPTRRRGVRGGHDACVAGIHVDVRRRTAAPTSEATGRPPVINYSGSVGAHLAEKESPHAGMPFGGVSPDTFGKSV